MWLRDRHLVALEEDWQDLGALQAQLWKLQNLQAELDTSARHRQWLQMVSGDPRTCRPEHGAAPQPWQPALSPRWPTVIKCFLYINKHHAKHQRLWEVGTSLGTFSK